MNENDVLLNQAFCAPIESEDAKCNPNLGDENLTYEENDYFIFERLGQWYFVPERDKHGNWIRTIKWDKFLLLQSLFGIEFKPYSELPEEVI